MPANELHTDDADALHDLEGALTERVRAVNLDRLALHGLAHALDKHGDVERYAAAIKAAAQLQHATTALLAALANVGVALEPARVPLPAEVELPTVEFPVLPLPDEPAPVSYAEPPQLPAERRGPPPEGQRTGGPYLDRQRAAEDVARHAASMPATAQSDETAELPALDALLRPDLSDRG